MRDAEEILQALNLELGELDTFAPDETIHPRDSLRATDATLADSPSGRPIFAPQVTGSRSKIGRGKRGERSEWTRSALGLDELPILTLSESDDASADLRLSALLGEGGMGVVHLARQRSLDRDVAIKRTHDSSSAPATALIAEAVLTGRLEHPNIIPVHALGRDRSDRPILVMKRVEGVAWSDLLADPDHPKWDSLPADRMDFHLAVLCDLCDALAFAHDRGVLHRDLKPANVMLGDYGEVYLLDWGVAVELNRQDPDAAWVFAGTPAYMAPEMVQRTGTLSKQTDVYLLGATLHFVLTGQTKHLGNVYNAIVSADESLPYDYPPDVPEELGELCNQACSREQSQRYADAPAFKRAIRQYLSHRGSTQLSDTATQRLEGLESLVAVDNRDEAHIANVHQAYHQSRFGFEESLREWPGNKRAQRGLQRALEAMVRHEIAMKNMSSARALFAELDSPSQPLVEALDALKRLLHAESETHERLKRLEHELDPNISSSSRRKAFAAGGVFIVLGIAGMVVSRSFGVDLFGYPLLIGIPVFVLVASFFVVSMNREAFLGTAINRRMGATAAILGCGVVLNRSFAAALDLPIAQAIGNDCLLTAAVAAAAAIWIRPLFLAATVIFVVAAGFIVGIPDQAPIILGVGLVSSLGVLLTFRR